MKYLLRSLLSVVDPSHFVAILYCSFEQAVVFKEACLEEDSGKGSLKCDILFIEGIDSASSRLSSSDGRVPNVIQNAVLLTGNVKKDYIIMGNKPTNFFGIHFGKHPKPHGPFRYPKNPDLAAFWLRRYASFEGAKCLEIFAGSMPSFAGACRLGIPMTFIEKDSNQFIYYEKMFQVYFHSEEYFC